MSGTVRLPTGDIITIPAGSPGALTLSNAPADVTVSTAISGDLFDDGGNSPAALGGVQTLSRYGLTEFAGNTGRLWLPYFVPPVSTILTKVAIASGGTAAAGVTLARMGLFTVAADFSLTLVARTASDTTIGGSTFNTYERSFSTVGGFPASYPLQSGVRYAFGFLQVATTMMTVAGQFNQDSATPPIACRIIEGQADIANSYAIGALTTYFTVPYMRGRV